MKRILFLSLVILLVNACSNGAKDDKNKAEPYPAYDTTDKVDVKNDPVRDSLR